MKSNFVTLLAPLTALILTAAVPAQACTSCGCALGTDWLSAGYSAGAGLRLDLRYDNVNQSDLRRGTHRASAAEINAALADGSVEETQLDTVTHFLTLGLDYGIDRDWSVNAQLPMQRRTHGSLMDGDSDASRSEARGIGDLRIAARYQGLVEDRSWGLQFGLKLPTGDFRQRFSQGPAAGEMLDRGLQLGSGTTDAIVGVYHVRAVTRSWDAFEQLEAVLPMTQRSDFRPGKQVSAHAGLRYLGLPWAVPQAQLNFKLSGRESGAESDRANSGSRELYLSPGLSVGGSSPLSGFVFVQLPLYRDYQGLQLAPAEMISTGLRYRF